ncbi:hypothetical protein E1263_22735 [Kribbella antibiotica]|uniref:Trypsin-like serine protease n=1 Tax=Kribbella antibiotica TaxID=190195 RepID=A0A4V2YPB0_9ACTN|nr:hypothetical protein [Kribbella antibiotica]TDD57647.1 hypothetical protein E1263_22735 [Kribbella antibiotica]
MRKFVVLAATAAVALGAGLAGSPAAFSAPAPDVSPSNLPPSVSGRDNPGPAFWDKQAKVVEVADAITAAYKRISGDSGYAGLVVDAASNSITLNWRGQVPASVTKATTNASGVTVNAVPTAKYSYQELAKATGKVIAERTSINGTEVVAAGPLADGSGLQVTAKGGATKAAVRNAISAVAGGVAVSVVNGSPEFAVAPPSVFGPTSRWNQQAFGGARWRLDNGGGCSQGFALGWAGDSAMATAAHCGALGSGARNPENNARYGTVTNRYENRDIEAIRADNQGDKGFFQASMWWGDVNGQQLWPVRGLTGNYPGMVTCSSGSYSGSLCDIVITANGVTVCLSGLYCVYGAVDVYNRTGGPVWGQGDSGGPVSIPIGSDVRAGGIISAIDTARGTGCAGEQNRQCANRGWYSPLDQWTGETGFTLRTQ